MERVNPDFSVLMTGDSSSLLDGFGFLQFIQIFLLGDTRVLLSIVPRVSVGLFGQDDDIVSNTRTSKSFLGDPVKNTMLLQSIRRFPVITAVPLIVTVILLVVDVASLLNPMVHRILFAIPSLSPVMAPFLEDFIQHEERLDPVVQAEQGDNDGVDGILDVNGPFEQIVPDINQLQANQMSRAGMAAPVISRQQLHSDYYNKVVLQLEQVPLAVHGMKQSPVDISSNHPVVLDSRLGEFTFQYSSESQDGGVLSNTGLGWNVRVASSENIVKGGFMSGNYILDHYTMHWGESEHTIDGERYHGELQMYHRHHQYPDWGQAVHQPAGVVVVAVLLQVGDDQPVTELDKIVKYLPKIEMKGEEVVMEDNLDLVRMLPGGRDFFVYNGSLTTPDFTETVTWVLMRDSVMVSAETIGAMTSLKYGVETESPRMMNNCRKQVMLGDRQVLSSWDA